MKYEQKEPEDAFHHRLAAMVRHYWREKGFEIATHVEMVPRKVDRWQIRSDMLNGLPRSLALKGMVR